MTYKTSLDGTAKGISIGVTLLFALIIIAPFSIIKNEERVIPIFTSFVCLTIYLLVCLLRPISYLLIDNKLIVHRLFKDIKIDRDKISSAKLLGKNEIGFVTRTFGVGGFFGYFGKFSSFKIGKMTFYATRKDNMVLITTIDNKQIILTPNDLNQFVTDINA